MHVASWQPASDRPERLPAPLEYDVLQQGLIQLDVGQRHTLLQCISCYQVGSIHSSPVSLSSGVIFLVWYN